MSLRRILLIADISPGYIEGVLRGVGIRARPDLPWLFDLVKPNPAVVRKACREGADGAIAVSMTQSIRATLDSSGIPVVNTGPRDFAPQFPHAGNDDVAIGRMAAKHFLDRGFTNLAYVSLSVRGTDYPIRRGEGFSAEAVAAGSNLAMRGASGSPSNLGRWLAGLSPPVGILAASDVVAWQVLEACRLAGLRVPEEIAVLGVDDDQALCHLAYPSLSSIRVASRQIGIRAAEMLAEMLTHPGRRLPGVEIPPIGVAVRQSTDIFAITDPVVAEALRWIDRHATSAMSVNEIAAHVAVSRRALEQRFHSQLGRSPREEIERVRLNLVRKMLIDSTCPIDEIARLCGFRVGKRLSTVFRRVFGVRPSDLRRKNAW